MSNYYYKNNNFIIEDYDKQPPFSSFLPGIAGIRGIPIWAFYVNRGQGISSFGIRDKNGAILEFFPANSAYMYIDRIGFRTFVKVDGEVVEIFKDNSLNQRKMIINQSEVSFIEKNTKLNLSIKVTYFILPNEDFGGLVRRIELIDLAEKTREIQILDGLPQILPSGIDYGGYKAVSNLLRSWMEVDNLENNIAFYKLRSSTSDSAIVEKHHDGNFYLSFKDDNLIKPITDCDLIFDYDTSLSEAIYFQKHDLKEIYLQEQVTKNKVPCGFSGVNWNTANDKVMVINTIIGYTKDISLINQKAKEIIKPNYIIYKNIEAKKIIEDLTENVKTTTAYPIFDAYIRQNYLDNIIRGGHPVVFEGENQNNVYHIYSRKHGDLERDYNFFVIAPEFYSQGNGNFRDVCQNRRNDVLINPKVRDYNVFVFANLIQADGYNPLGVNGSTFKLKEDVDLVNLIGEASNNNKLKKLLETNFTPGNIATCLWEENIVKLLYNENVLQKIIANSNQLIEAEFGEGFWQDHWTYILELIENYLMIYPDKKDEILYERFDYKYFQSPCYVLPRKDKYVLTADETVRQYDAIHHDYSIKNKWLKDENNNEISTNLFSKLLVLVVNKYCCLDPEGIGISYEANKPGWNDAMNGVPGLFGSGVGESIELYRLVSFLEKNYCSERKLILPIEFIDLLIELKNLDNDDLFIEWDKRTDLLEAYREKIRYQVKSNVVYQEDILDFLIKIKKKVYKGLNKAYKLGNGIFPTYIIYEATSFEKITDKNQVKTSTRGLVNVNVKGFKLQVLPLFLEAPARALKTDIRIDKQLLYDEIKQSEMFDNNFKFYKTSCDLSEVTLETGRIVAFTKGWFERESNFLHMTYKYLLGLLKANLYDEFFEEIKTNFVCFMNPLTYGRSILENSSFLAPSNNPDQKLHGKGFVARLSGSTSEVLSMWYIMFFGKEIFQMEDGQLVFKLKPILSKDFFNNDVVKVYLFGNIEVTYLNESKLDTYHAKISRIELFEDDEKYVINDDFVKGPLAHKVRNGNIKKINIYINK